MLLQRANVLREPVLYSVLATPLGDLALTADSQGLLSALFVEQEQRLTKYPITLGDNPHISEAKRQFAEYFAGQRQQFDLTLAPFGTAFQRQVWFQLLTIPYGESRSYSDIAEALASPNAVRAVAGANAKNPLSIVVPCHRVIGKNGQLTGYAGGLARKDWLLKLEQGLGNNLTA